MRPFIDRAYGFEGYRIGFNRPCNDRLREVPTMTCRHCRVLVMMNPERKRARGHCRRCDAYVCDDCLIGATCPSEKA